MNSKDLITKFKLPGYIAGKSFAEASQAIDKKFEGRNDLISKSTRQELLKRLAEAQEHVKSLQEEPTSNQMFSGGFAGYTAGQADDAAPEATTAAAPKSGISNYYGMIGQAAGALGNGLKSESATSADNLMTDGEKSMDSGYEAVKSGVAAAIPIAGLFKGLGELGEGAGQAIGGDRGGDIAKGFFDPFSNVMRKDTNFGDKLLSVLDPVVAGIITNKKNAKRRNQLGKNTAMSMNGAYDDNGYAEGGYVDDGNGDVDPKLRRAISDAYNKYNFTGYGQNSFAKPGLVTDDSASMQPVYDKSGQLTTVGTMNATAPKKEMNTGIGDWLGNNYGNILRYAPVAANAYQLATLKKAPPVKYNNLANRYNPEYVDEASLERIADQEMNSQINGISQMGGSQGAIRNAMLAAGLNKAKTRSDSYMNASAQNRATNDRAQQFNLGIDQFNTQTNNRAIDEMRADAGAYETEKSKLIGQLGTDVGNIGKEELFKRYPKMMGLGYDWNGKYFINKNGDIKTVTEAASLETGTNKTAKGGFLQTMSYIKTLK